MTSCVVFIAVLFLAINLAPRVGATDTDEDFDEDSTSQEEHDEDHLLNQTHSLGITTTPQDIGASHADSNLHASSEIPHLVWVSSEERIETSAEVFLQFRTTDTSLQTLATSEHRIGWPDLSQMSELLGQISSNLIVESSDLHGVLETSTSFGFSSGLEPTPSDSFMLGPSVFTISEAVTFRIEASTATDETVSSVQLYDSFLSSTHGTSFYRSRSSKGHQSVPATTFFEEFHEVSSSFLGTTEQREPDGTEYAESSSTEHVHTSLGHSESASLEYAESISTEHAEATYTEHAESSTGHAQSTSTERVVSASVEYLQSTAVEQIESTATERADSNSIANVESTLVEHLQSTDIEDLQSVSTEQAESTTTEPAESPSAQIWGLFSQLPQEDAASTPPETSTGMRTVMSSSLALNTTATRSHLVSTEISSLFRVSSTGSVTYTDSSQSEEIAETESFRGVSSHECPSCSSTEHSSEDIAPTTIYSIESSTFPSDLDVQTSTSDTSSVLYSPFSSRLHTTLRPLIETISHTSFNLAGSSSELPSTLFSLPVITQFLPSSWNIHVSSENSGATIYSIVLSEEHTSSSHPFDNTLFSNGTSSFYSSLYLTQTGGFSMENVSHTEEYVLSSRLDSLNMLGTPFPRVLGTSSKSVSIYMSYTSDTVISSSLDTVISSSLDTIISSSLDTIISSSLDTVISSSLDTIISSSLDTVISASLDRIRASEATDTSTNDVPHVLEVSDTSRYQALHTIEANATSTNEVPILQVSDTSRYQALHRTDETDTSSYQALPVSGSAVASFGVLPRSSYRLIHESATPSGTLEQSMSFQLQETSTAESPTVHTSLYLASLAPAASTSVETRLLLSSTVRTSNIVPEPSFLSSQWDSGRSYFDAASVSTDLTSTTRRENVTTSSQGIAFTQSAMFYISTEPFSPTTITSIQETSTGTTTITSIQETSFGTTLITSIQETSFYTTTIVEQFSTGRPRDLSISTTQTAATAAPSTTVEYTPPHMETSTEAVQKTPSNFTIVIYVDGDCQKANEKKYAIILNFKMLQFIHNVSQTDDKNSIHVGQLRCNPNHIPVSFVQADRTLVFLHLNDTFSNSSRYLRIHSIVLKLTGYSDALDAQTKKGESELTPADIAIFATASCVCIVLIIAGLAIFAKEIYRKKCANRFSSCPGSLSMTRKTESVALRNIPTSKSDYKHVEMNEEAFVNEAFSSPCEDEYSSVASERKTAFPSSGANSPEEARDTSKSKKSTEQNAGNTTKSISASSGSINNGSSRHESPGYGLIIGLMGYTKRLERQQQRKQHQQQQQKLQFEESSYYAVPQKRSKTKQNQDNTKVNATPTPAPFSPTSRPIRVADSPVPPPRHLRTVHEVNESYESNEELVPFTRTRTDKSANVRTDTGVDNPSFLNEKGHSDVDSDDVFHF